MIEAILRASSADGIRLRSAVFWLISVCTLLMPLGVDRSRLLDHADYIEYFASARDFDWAATFFPAGQDWWAWIALLLTEEFVWRVWTYSLSNIASPEAAVYLTVAATSALMVAATRCVPYRELAISLWAVLPFGMAVLGLYQIRQGFAFSLLAYLLVARSMPVIGSAIAAMIHTTFAVTLAFHAVSGIMGRAPKVGATVTILVGAAIAGAAGQLFEFFGGRRIEAYSLTEGATSPAFILGALICALPSICLIAVGNSVPRQIISLAMTHLGVIAFAIVSYFAFPLGTGRLAYMIQLFLIFLLPYALVERSGWRLVLLPTAAFLAYTVVKELVEGRYQYLLAY